MKMLWKTHLIAAVMAVPALTGNAVTPAASPLQDSIPSAWSYESPQLITSPSDDRWWEEFDDPVLTDLIRRGGAQSLDLRQTYRRIEIARQNVLESKAAYSPTLGLSAGWTRERSSGDMMPHGAATTMSYFSLGLNFSWEIDVFGRVRQQVKSGNAALGATKADYEAAMVSLASNIATAYINFRLAQGRAELARAQIESQRKIEAIAEARFETGLASKLDVTQARTVLYSTQATLPEIENAERSAIRDIALLTGCYPDSLAYLLKTAPRLPNPFRMVKVGVPADLLRRRPDVAAAEYELAGYAAQVGIAKKDFLPVLSLDGAVGTSARNIGDMFTDKSFTYSIAPSLSWTIFEGLARSRRVAAAKEQMLIGIDNYNQTVLSAYIETENALGEYEAYLKEISLIQSVCNTSDESFSLAVDRYKRGLAGFYDVMNSQLSVLQYRNSLLQTKAAALVALIKVYAAVAGSPER